MKILLRKNFSLLLVVFLLFFFHYFNLKFFLKSPLIFLQRNFFSSTLKSKEIFKIFSLKQRLLEENNKLREENNKLLLENKNLKIAWEENKILIKQTEFLKEKKYNYLLCNVIGKTSNNPLMPGVLILDRGEENGIKIGYPVIVDEGFLVGKIIKVDKNISYLNTIIDNQSAVAVKVLSDDPNQEAIQGIVKGEHQLSLKMDFILPDKKINKDMLIITSGLESLVVNGLIVGKVREVNFAPGDFFQKAVLDSLVDFDSLQIVSVLIPPDDN